MKNPFRKPKRTTRRIGSRLRQIGRGLGRAIGGAAKLTGEGLVQNAGVALVGAAALKLKGAASRGIASRPAPFHNRSSIIAQFKKGRPKGAKDKRPRRSQNSILPTKNQAFKITDKDIDKGLARAESASKSFGNVARGSRNIVASRKEAALAQRYENENSGIDIALRRTGKAVNTVDTARRTAQSIGLIRRSRTRGGNPLRRAAAGLRLLRRITS